MNSWNSLPDSVVNAKSVKEFEKKLDGVWKLQKQKFNYSEFIKHSHLDQDDYMTARASVSYVELESQAQ